MRGDEAFARDVEMRAKEDYPLLAALASGTLLEQARAETNVSEVARTELAKCFSRAKLLPLPVLLGLSRTKLLKEARSYLPLWQVIPVLNVIVRLLRRLFGAAKAARERDAAEGPGPGEAARTIGGADRARPARAEGPAAKPRPTRRRPRRWRRNRSRATARPSPP